MVHRPVGQKQRAIDEYRNVIKVAWEGREALEERGARLHSVTAEAAGYLIPLLDKNNDSEEIMRSRSASSKWKRSQDRSLRSQYRCGPV